ncbi:retrovirus-related pol polyprotein from transposon TNT 1-94 [Tanacetum coccineum]
MMSFLIAVVTSRYPTTNNQLRISLNPRQQVTINDGRIIVQPVQGRQISYVTGTIRTFTLGTSGNNSGKQRIITCYNCKGEGHMSKQCTKPRRKRDDSWFKDKVLLVQAQASAKIALMVNLSHYGLDALSEQLEPKLYVGDIIEKTNPIVIPDSEETLLLAEESHSKMLLRQKDPIMLEKKVNTTPVDYAALNQLYKDFETRFVPQTELSAEQAFWSQNSVNSSEPILSSRPTVVEVPKELPKVRLVNYKENVLVITARKNDLRKLKGKALVVNDVTKHPRRSYILRDLVEHVKSKYPLDQSLESACRSYKCSRYLDFGSSKHITGDRSQLTNFVNKFLGTVKFGNDHVAKILGYGDYQIGKNLYTLSLGEYDGVLSHYVLLFKGLKDYVLDYGPTCFDSILIEEMQEELNEFERLEVWELVPRPDKVMVITLKWIYKVKLDELGGILKNKARLVARGYRQEEGIDFEESFASV